MALLRPSATARLQLSTLVSTSRAASPWEWSVDVHGGGTAASPSQPRHVLLFLSGWPDDKRAWTPTAQAVASDEIMCGVICMPGYEDVASARKGIPGGFDIEDVVTIVEKTVEKLLQHASCSKLTLVLHDWGTDFALTYVCLCAMPESMNSHTQNTQKKAATSGACFSTVGLTW